MRLYSLNHFFFKQHSVDMFYLLGFILADGCVHKLSEKSFSISIGLHSKDEHILKSFREMLGSSRPLYYKNNNTIALCINSLEIAEDLKSFGIDERKSLTSTWPEYIPEEYLSHFVRGFFDGDGSVFKIKHPAAKRDYIGINFTGTKNFLIELQKNINKILGKEYGHMRELKIKNGFYYQLVYSGDATIKKFIDWIYTDSNESNRLKRKYDLSQEYFSNLDFIKPQRETFTKATSKNSLLKFNIDGEEMSLTEMQNDERCKVSRSTLYHRIKNLNLSPEDAMTMSKEDLPKQESPNYINKKISNHSKIDWEIASDMRQMKKEKNLTAQEIADHFGFSTSLVFDVLSNRSWIDPNYQPIKFDNSAKMYTHNSITATLTEWSSISGVPKNTIDRRLREGKTFEQAITPGRISKKIIDNCEDNVQ